MAHSDTLVPSNGNTPTDHRSVAERVRSYVAQNFLFRDELDIPAGASLLDAGILDSLGVMELVAFLEEEFCLTLEDRDLVRDNLDSVAGISALVTRHLDEA